METAAQQQQCSSCDDVSARCWCVECNEALCDACVSAHHRVTVTRSHQILNQPPSGNFSTPPIKFCRLHPSEPLKLFCFTCNQFTCRDCQLTAHKNHRYQFVSEVLDDLKKQLELLVQPIKALSDTLRQSLLDMEISLENMLLTCMYLSTNRPSEFRSEVSCLLCFRLEDITGSLSQLEKELLQSYNIIFQMLKKRMMTILEDSKKVGQMERDQIQMRMAKLKQLQHNHQSVSETVEKARNTRDLCALLQYKDQIESGLKSFGCQSLSPPSTMCQLKVVTNRNSWDAVLTFGALDVVWVPFSVSQPSNQNTGQSAAVATSSSLTCLAPSSGPLPLPHTSATVVMNSPVAPVLIPSTSKPLFSQMSFSSCSSTTQFSGVLTTPTTHTVQLPPPSTVKTLSHLGGQVLLNNPVQHAPASVSVSLGPALPSTLLELLTPKPVLNHSAAHPQSLPTAVLLNSPTVCQVFPIVLSQKAPSTVRQQKARRSFRILPALPPPQTSTCPSSSSKPLPQTGITSDANSPVVDKLVSPSNSLSTQLCLVPTSSITPPTSTGRPLPQTDGATEAASVTPDNHLSVPQQTLDQRLSSESLFISSPLKQQQSEVVRAVADSACDHSVQQGKARQQEPTENEPTSTVSEETEPAGKPSEQPSSVVRHLDYSLSQWQPRVTLFRLPMTPPCHRSDEDDEIYLKDISDSESHVDDLTAPLSSPESPVTLQLVSCSACGSAYGSIVCSACGRGYHRDCHVPAVGPDIWSEWICSLCLDLSGPSDPFSCDRPPGPQSPCLSVLDQRRCQSLLLLLKVEGCAPLSEVASVWSRLKLISERLTVHRSYQTAADFVSDVSSLFRDALQCFQDVDVLDKLQESFRSRLRDTLNLELPASRAKSASGGGSIEGGAFTAGRASRTHCDITTDRQEVVRSKLTEMRKRLRDLLVDRSVSKKMKTEHMEE